jgi:maltokinase
MTTERPAPVPDGHSARLVAALAGHREVPGLTLRSWTPVPPETAGELTERPITADQSNVSVVVGERYVVKWMNQTRQARAPRLMAHLTAVGFAGTPRSYGAAWAGDALVALVTAYLPGSADGWDWCVDALLAELAGGPPAAFGPDLGELAADLHAALATPSRVLPEPISTAPVPGPAPDLFARVRADAEAAGDEDGRWLAAHLPAIEADAAARPGGPVPSIEGHGDLHVGQVLRWAGGYAVIDFDGNPVAGAGPEPVARDLAQLRTSLLHVARIADRRTGGEHAEAPAAWGRRAADDLLDAYRARLAGHGVGHLLNATLLRAFEVEQECRELAYAARFLPRWRYAPMGVLRSWYG